MPFEELTAIAKSIRLGALEAAVKAGRGHLGGTYSCVDILVALYYGGILQADKPLRKDRDRFIFSKGHACLALYPILYDLGFITQEQLDSYGTNGGLGAQLDITIPGVDWNTGSLGHSLGVCAGIALAAKMDNKGYHAYTLIGDAECDEGSIFEAIKFAGDMNLYHLTCIVDRNRLSVTDHIEKDSFLDNCHNTIDPFEWDCIRIDGHDIEEMINVFALSRNSLRPTMIIANTIKGKGVSFMENEQKWHHELPQGEQLELARKELSNA